MELSQSEVLVLTCIAYFQPITRAELSSFFGKEISRDLIGHLRGAGLIASGPRSPTPGAPYTYVATKQFLLDFGLGTLRDLPDFEALEDAGLLSKEKLLSGDIPAGLGEDRIDPLRQVGRVVVVGDDHRDFGRHAAPGTRPEWIGHGPAPMPSRRITSAAYIAPAPDRP